MKLWSPAFPSRGIGHGLNFRPLSSSYALLELWTATRRAEPTRKYSVQGGPISCATPSAARSGSPIATSGPSTARRRRSGRSSTMPPCCTRRRDRAAVSLRTSGAPRLKPEIAFRLKAPLPAGRNDPARVLAVVEWVSPSFESVDCHFADEKFSSAESAADFSFHWWLIVGTLFRSGQRRSCALRTCGQRRRRGRGLGPGPSIDDHSRAPAGARGQHGCRRPDREGVRQCLNRALIENAMR